MKKEIKKLERAGIKVVNNQIAKADMDKAVKVLASNYGELLDAVCDELEFEITDMKRDNQEDKAKDYNVSFKDTGKDYNNADTWYGTIVGKPSNVEKFMKEVLKFGEGDIENFLVYNGICTKTGESIEDLLNL